ncbi:hypothetical protein BI081_gp190 [Mycobacterium phage Tonenili]|uniref:Uncharacterized protein n=1 Tax=Mycobacterium phage Tonenili TaxID=1891703 RepID=A0A1C9EHE4_9CAUD|nr:hypothetical protein BI081_gp190 [Mycobacterium phage Tonenili]AON96917.1 hypothetical protein SEA_TONENILI_170 [Mycobacterium phage Tonenili]
MSPGWVLLGLGQLTVTFWGTWWLIHPNHAHERQLVLSRLTLRRNRVERPAKRSRAKRKAPGMDALYTGIGISAMLDMPGIRADTREAGRFRTSINGRALYEEARKPKSKSRSPFLTIDSRAFPETVCAHCKTPMRGQLVRGQLVWTTANW